jgi:SUN domain-containing protein 1/2
MSQLNGRSATPATRRSARLSQAGSVAQQSVITTVTTSGTKQRKRGPLAQVAARKSNTYGSSGRVGAAEALSITATGFAQAFQEQRGDEDDDDDEDDDEDELGSESPKMSGALNGFSPNRGHSVEPEIRTPGFHDQSFQESENGSPSENGSLENSFPSSFGNTSKSFGLEGDMLHPKRNAPSRLASEDRPWSPPLWQKNMTRKHQARVDDQIEKQVQRGIAPAVEKRPAQIPRPAFTDKALISQPVNRLVAEEQGRPQREVPPAARNGSINQAPAQHATGPSIAAQWLDIVSTWPWKKYAIWAFGSVVGLLILWQAFGFLMSSNFPESSPRMPSLTTVISDRVAYQKGRLIEWIQPPGPMTEEEKRRLAAELEQLEIAAFKGGDDNIMWDRLRKLNKKIDGKVDDIHNLIKELQDDLPAIMIVRGHEDGRREITDDFWHALIAKARSQEDDPAWIDYLKSNEQKMRDIVGVPTDISDSGHSPKLVSRQEFVKTMEEHYKNISARVDEHVYNAIQGQAAQIKAIAQAEVRQAAIDSIRLGALAESNIVANYELTFRKTNYFSSGLGAMVDPALTSVTFLDNPQWHTRFARRLTRVPLRNPPKSALERWEEPGDCWCAAPNPSMKGQAQLTVSVPNGVFPEQVTIEHLPKEMMPGKKITNAPRILEFWVQSEQPAQYQYAHREGLCGPGPEGWTCLGSFTYNIHASNHQQTFDLDAKSPVSVTKAMLRVTSNWGADHTCLYRVRVHGRDAAPEHEYEVRLSDPV